MPSDDLLRRLPELLPRAIAWARREAAQGAQRGRTLTVAETALARGVGVANPEQVRVIEVDGLPAPDDPELAQAAAQVGMLGPDMDGLTLGHAIFIRRGRVEPRLLSHELRHVHQYEQAGSIDAFLPDYLFEVVQHGYHEAAHERDARAHERA
jgi:hypothetical protein